MPDLNTMSFAGSPARFVAMNKVESATDFVSMYSIDTLNRLSLRFDKGGLAGMVVGVGIWQYWGKWYQDLALKKISLTKIITAPGSVEGIVEGDAELILGLKGGIYSLSVYLSSLVASRGGGDKMNLVDAVMIGYGGALSGAVIRNNMTDK